MKIKASRIDSSLWEQYKGEISALYQSGTLENMMNTMEEKYGFKATKNQYTPKIKAWGLEKYANATMWKHVAQKMKKRKLEGKDSIVEIRGRKRSRKSIDREISRNVTYTSQVQLLEDIPTPEGIQVFTPCAESLPVALRQVYIDNLPWFEFQRDVRMTMAQVSGNQIPGLYSGNQPSRQHKFLLSKHSATEMLKFALELGATPGLPPANRDMVAWTARPNNDLYKQTLKKFEHLALYVPSSDTDGPSPLIFGSDDMPHRSNPLHTFINYFVYMTSNDMLDRSRIMKGLEFLSQTCESTFLQFLLARNSVPIKLFMRKIFPSIVDSGNTTIAKAIIDSGIDMSDYRHPSRQDSIVGTYCMSIAVGNGDQKMVELLCKEKFSTEIYWLGDSKLPWNLGKLDILRTLLLFGADPECFVRERSRGFPLSDAASSGRLEAVYMLLAAGANVNSYDPYHYGTALQAAIYTNRLEVAELLIELGADVNAPDRTHMQSVGYALGMPRLNPFEIAVKNNNIPMVKLLITHGAQVHVCVTNPDEDFREFGCCPLHSAVQNRNADLAGFLLCEGVDVNCRDGRQDDDTPLQAAARRNHPEMVKFLLLQGADVNAPPDASNGRTAIQAAAESGNIEIVQMLLELNADVNAPAAYADGLTALQAAIKNRHPLMAGALYTAGADLNAPPAHSGGLTAIQAAAMNGDLDLLRNLIDWGAEIDGPTSKEGGFTVMEAATLSKNMSILEFLVEQGVNINASASENNASRCLAIAASNDWLDYVRYLLEIGADVDGYYDSPHYELEFNALGWAVYLDNTTMMTLLLDGGVDVYSPTDTDHQCALSMGLTWALSSEAICLLLSKSQDLEKVCRRENILLFAINPDVEDSQIFRKLLNAINGLPKDLYDDQLQKAWHILPWFSWINGLNKEFMELLLDSGIDINSRSDDNTTALHRVLNGDQTDIFKYLVEKGAEINTPAAADKGTLLQEAIRKENIEIVTLLLERGADINAVPAEIRGITALQAASINGLTGLAIELLRRGASVAEPAAPGDGRTAINGAAEHGRLDILQLLLNHYDGDEDITTVCDTAATYAEEEGHVEIAEWLRQYPVV